MHHFRLRPDRLYSQHKTDKIRCDDLKMFDKNIIIIINNNGEKCDCQSGSDIP